MRLLPPGNLRSSVWCPASAGLQPTYRAIASRALAIISVA